MQRHTELTQQDLRIYKSQRLTDTPDGGGRMVNEPLTGADNELFPPISDVDKAMGAFDARAAYAAVLRDDAAGLYGANVIVSQPPKAENVSILLVKGDFYGQERADIMERIESYRTSTTETRMTLLGKQRKGSRMVQAYQREGAPLPVVGDVFALRVIENRLEVFEFFRVEKLATELREFEDSQGVFKRVVFNMTTAQALERDFEGVANAQRFYVAPPALVMQTQIADSASYYGIKPVAAEVKRSDGSLKLPTIYEQLVPVSVLEAAIADDWAQGRAVWIETAPERQIYIGGTVTGSVYLECPVLPGSLKANGWTDDGRGSLINQANVDLRISVDYANGVITGNTSIGAVSAVPAVQVRNQAYSAFITVDDTNVGTEFAPLLRPAPARGSVQVSYRSGNTWYTLTDYGDFALRDESSTQRGSISPNGSAVISLPAVPDSPSQIIVSWCPKDYYHALDGSEAGQAIAPQTLDTELVIPPTPVPNLVPSSIKLTWAGSSARDDGKGNLTGGCTGTVNYATGQIRPVGLTAPQVRLEAKQYSANATTKSATANVARGSNLITLVADSPIQRGSLKLALQLTRTTATGYSAGGGIFTTHK